MGTGAELGTAAGDDEPTSVIGGFAGTAGVLDHDGGTGGAAGGLGHDGGAVDAAGAGTGTEGADAGTREGASTGDFENVRDNLFDSVGEEVPNERSG